MKSDRQINLHFFAGIYFLLFFVSVAFNEKEPYLKFPKLGPLFVKTMVYDIFLGTAVGIAIVGITWILTNRSKMFGGLVQNFHKLLGNLNHVEIFFIAAFSSLSEEFFFRGLVQGNLGVFFASLMFGALHTGPGKQYLPWTAFALAMGFLLGGLYEWRDNLIVPVIIHFVVNFANLHLMMKRKIKKTASTEINS